MDQGGRGRLSLAGRGMTQDTKTAEAFADSWNNLPAGSVYTREQFQEWFDPITREDVQGKSVLELGCGNGSLLVHMAGWNPSRLVGVDLGSSVVSARKNMEDSGYKGYELVQADLTTFASEGFDLTYSIGVLHHLKEPGRAFRRSSPIPNPAVVFIAGFMREKGTGLSSTWSIHCEKWCLVCPGGSPSISWPPLSWFPTTSMRSSFASSEIFPWPGARRCSNTAFGSLSAASFSFAMWRSTNW